MDTRLQDAECLKSKALMGINKYSKMFYKSFNQFQSGINMVAQYEGSTKPELKLEAQHQNTQKKV